MEFLSFYTRPLVSSCELLFDTKPSLDYLPESYLKLPLRIVRVMMAGRKKLRMGSRMNMKASLRPPRSAR